MLIQKSETGEVVVAPPRTVLGLWIWVAVFSLVSMMSMGLKWTDIDIVEIWQNLSVDGVRPVRQFLISNPLYNVFGHFVSRAFGPGGMPYEAFKPFTLLILAGAFVVLLEASRRRYGVERASIFLGAIALSTLDYTLFHWVGKSDALFVASYALLFVNRRSIVAHGVCFFLLFGIHPGQGVVVAWMHALILFHERRLSVGLVAGIVAGLVAGALFQAFYEYFWQISGHVSRIDRLTRNDFVELRHAVGNFLNNHLLAILTVLFGLWPFVLKMIDSRRTMMIFGLLILTAIGVSSLFLDWSRVATLLVMPLIFFVSERLALNWRAGQGLPPWMAASLVFVAVFGVELKPSGISAQTDNPIKSALQ